MGVVAVSLMLLLPVQAHTESEIEAWLADWQSRVVEAETITWELITERQDFAERHPYYFDPPGVHAPVIPITSRSGRGMGSNVEQWRGLVAAYFPSSEVERALCIMNYESGGNPNADNPRSTAAGLFQFLSGTWAITPWASSSVYDPEPNIAAAAWLVAEDGWHHWSPWNRGLCR